MLSLFRCCCQGGQDCRSAHLDRKVPLGQGKVNFPAVLARLKELGFDGALIIEREISGAQQTADIRTAVVYLRGLVDALA